MAAYSALAIIFLTSLFFVTEPTRKTSAIVASTTTFLNCIKSGDYKDAYSHISRASQESYPLADFIADHSRARIKIQDFTIDQVLLNKFDKKKASAVISSPFTLYGQGNLSLELIKEEGEWRVVFSRNIVMGDPVLKTIKAKKKGGLITNFLNSLF
jgi:hypothetical protein